MTGMTSEEIRANFPAALAERRLQVYYQPQYNSVTGLPVGAEALVRWLHPTLGLIPPLQFLPALEDSPLMTRLDLYVFETVCGLLAGCIARGESVLPVSVNVTKEDVLSPDFVERLERIREKYSVPAKYIPIELTEFTAAIGVDAVNAFIRKLHSYGYSVEMDDFGSGYSSLNVLKDLDVDVIKLDLTFLRGKGINERGSMIITSIVRMAKWLGLPIMAEGVETPAQLEFLRSIACKYIQGYIFSRPVPEEEFLPLISSSDEGFMIPRARFINALDADRFWSDESLETLIFSNFVGGAAVFTYDAEQGLALLRLNRKYLTELGMNNSEEELISADPWAPFDEANRAIYEEMLKRAEASGDEEECETWRSLSSKCCGDDKICIRATVRMIGTSEAGRLFYAQVRNVTAEKLQMARLAEYEARFDRVIEQVKIYYWEYIVATKEMHPCFRCMRDLGLPPIVHNYPEPAISAGIFPPDYADMYRDWHRQIAKGVPELEAVIPLTIGRVPFRVRYSTEFDEYGRPVKAYGSATLIVD